MFKPHPARNDMADSIKTPCRGSALALPESRRKMLTHGLIPTAALVLTAAPVIGFATDTPPADQADAAQQSASSQQSGGEQQSGTTQDQQSTQAPQAISTLQLSEITITAAEVHSLTQFTPTGSRLGLTLQELPATLNVISSDEMLGRGFSSVEDAADSQAGVTSGGTPGDLEEFSTRGFTGDEITLLRDGLYIGPEDMIGRPQNTFNIASVEVLKGPASVLFGQGAVGGAVNVVDKGPSFGPSSLEALLSVGSFGSTSLGAGGGTHSGDDLAYRADVSRTASDGYVTHTGGYSNEATASVTWRVTPTLALQLSMDYMQDQPSNYFGTPLVPVSFAADPLNGIVSSSTLTIDQRTRSISYNVGDSHIGSTQAWPHIFLTWHPTSDITFENYLYYLHAYREWYDAETYTFSLTEPGYIGIPRINRDRFFVIHHQSMVGDQGSLSYGHSLFGHANKVVVGYEYSNLRFYRTAGAPNGDNVDPFEPDPGIFNTQYPTPLASSSTSSKWNDYAAFFEDVFDLTKSLRLVTGAHYDDLQLRYHSYSDGSGYRQKYATTSERIGLVYNITDYLTPYVAYSTANDPPNGEIFDSQSVSFPASHAWQIEAGMKGGTPDRMFDFTAAVYKIKRDNILTETSIDVLTNIGSQLSKGAEFSTDFKPTQNWTVSVNGAYTDSRFGGYIDPNTGVNDTGNQPANVPKFITNVWTSYRNVFGIPLELGGGVRYVGKRYADEANTLILDHYTLVNFYGSYHLTSHALVTARVNNAFDKAYADWADIYYPTQVTLGAPRYFELSLVMKY